MKQYLGDSVYVDVAGHMLVLTTENGSREESNRIYLEPTVWFTLLDYVARLPEQKGTE